MVQNQSNAPVHIRFDGPVKRDFLVQVGSSKITLNTGKYTYQYSACGEEFAGKIDTSSSRIIKIKPCKTTRLILKNYTLKESPVKLLVLRLNGPMNYYFRITEPIEKLSILQGTYTYSLYGCGKLIESGTLKLESAQVRWEVHCSP